MLGRESPEPSKHYSLGGVQLPTRILLQEVCKALMVLCLGSVAGVILHEISLKLPLKTMKFIHTRVLEQAFSLTVIEQF